ncbi:MAG TPA: CHASE sensor domain-containing protein [Holophagaceae bacterium]|nr:CHASE sensor domain-containing protein [Holophagaceae bacterium]
MKLLQLSSLRRKLILVIMLTVGLALVLAGTAFVSIEIRGFRASAQRELQILADVLGEGSTAALEFREPTDAARLLSTLRVHHRISEAAILDVKGQLFASYQREGGTPLTLPTHLPSNTFVFEGDHLWLTSPIRHAGDHLGTLYLRSDRTELNQRLRWVIAGGLLGTILIGSAALLLAMRMGRLASEPILHLTEAARRMAKRQDPGERVQRETVDEVGMLVDAFNDMLDQLGERQARLVEAQHLAHLGNWAYDPLAQHSEWSEETFRIFGLAPEGPVPDDAAFQALVHPEDREKLATALDRAMEEGGRFELDHRVLRADGAVGWVHVSGARFDGPTGRSVLRGTVIDITERKHAEAAMLQGQKLESLGVLTGGIAHDFNNLLAALQGFLDIVRLDLPSGAPAETYLDKADRVIARASDLIRQMLAYSGRAKFQVRPFDLSHLVEEMSHLLSVSISKKAELRVRAGHNLPAVVGDTAQIQQVIMNLVINASDALQGKEGLIRVSTRSEWLDAESLQATYSGQAMEPGLYIVLEVEDNGHGMDAQTMSRIFDPFFTTKFTGRGLGLAAMLGIVKGHRGGIKVYSEVGLGTAFKVLFPASPDGAAKPEDFAVGQGYQGSGKVLIVDDEPDLLTTTAAAFEHLGFEVVLASNGLEGVGRVKEHLGSLRLVVLDFTMPLMDGAECLRVIQGLDPTLPVLMTSGFSEGDSSGPSGDLPLAGFLQKPYTLATLQAKVREILTSPPSP